MSKVSTRPVLLAAGLSAVAVLLTIAVVAGWTQSIDDAVLSWMERMETPWLLTASEILDRLGSVPIVAGVIGGGFVILAIWGRVQTGLFWLALVVVTTGGSELIEEIVARPRPESSLIIKTSFSYPSGHAMVSGVAIGIGFAVVASTVWPRHRRFLLVVGGAYAAAAALGRLYLRAHWLTDVVAGLVMGMAILAVAIHLWRRHRWISTDSTHPASTQMR